jgi:quercetin dioxygenase-like cupin family protein
MSAFADTGSIEPQRIWDGVDARAVHGERVTLTVIELEPDAVVPEHQHENEQLGVVIRGSITFRIGDETRELGPGGTWRILANAPHSVTTGPEGAVLVEAFAPARVDWQGLETDGTRPPRWP